MGDLVQTTPVMAGLKEKHPAVRITLLVSSAFSEICNYIPFVDRVFSIDINDVVSKLNSGRLVECFYYLEDIIDKVNSTCYDLTINFTHSSDSAVLTSLINTKEIRGLGIDPEGHTIKKHPWIRYFFNVIPGRDFNPFHLCDMYIKAGGAMPGRKGLYLNVHPDTEKWVDTILGENGAGKRDLVIGLQLGASAEEKRWPVRSFAALANRLVETTGAKIVLTGSEKETVLGKEFEDIARIKAINLIGKTDLKELAALLKRCDLLISNDTGPLHIATAVGTTTINISLASVHFRETGPYGEGHYVIAPDIPCSPCNFRMHCKDHVCKRSINDDNVFALIKRIITKDASTIEDSPQWETVQVYESFFDADGLIDYRPLIKRPLTKNALFRHIYRRTWLNILDGKEMRDTASICQYLNERFREWYDCDSARFSDIIKDELNALMRLQSLADIALTKVTHIALEARKSSPDTGWIKEAWEGVPVIDYEIEAIGYTQPPLRPLTLLFGYEKEGLEGRDLISLSEKTCSIYKSLKTHASIMIQILNCLMEEFMIIKSPLTPTNTPTEHSAVVTKGLTM